MSPNNRSVSTISGTFPAIPTHLTRQREVDESAQEQTCGRLVRAGADGLRLLGSTGDVMAHNKKRRHAMASAAHHGANGSIPPVTRCSANSTTAAQMAIEAATTGGSQGLLVRPPFNYLSPKDAVVESYDDAKVLGTRLETVLESLMKMANKSRKKRRNS